MLYDIEGNQEDLEEIGLIAYNFIGNKNTQLKKAVVDVINGIVELPCDADIIEAVTYEGYEDWNSVSNIKTNGDYSSMFVESYIETNKDFPDPHYISGKFVKYKRAGNKLQVFKGFDKVTILYHAIILDDNGLPQITDKEAIAIAEYIAYVCKYKEAIRTNNGNILKIAQDLKQQWLFHCDAARSPESISQNDMDKILSTQASMGRKFYSKSYKPTL